MASVERGRVRDTDALQMDRWTHAACFIQTNHRCKWEMELVVMKFYQVSYFLVSNLD